jgi:hypothetical protein
MGISIWMTRHTLFSGAVALHDTVLEDERHLRNLLLTKKQDQPPITPRKAKSGQLHPVSR